ncbi:MAG: hypothetical protein SGPRY_010226 [Prymnesium sp.]
MRSERGRPRPEERSALIDAPSPPPLPSSSRRRGDSLESEKRVTRLSAPPHECHGQCYGFEKERADWPVARLTYSSSAPARPGYASRTASEYQDEPSVLRAKVECLARLLRESSRSVVYAGAGLSTAAGIPDYATSRRGGDAAIQAQGEGTYRSPTCAQPTQAHRVLVGLYHAGLLYRVIQQNHDGLPQKAGMPQHVVNEIHGSIHSPDNPVVPMSGDLREDLFQDLLRCEQTADLTIAVGTSLCGMNADRVVSTPAGKAPKQALGSVVISLQRTVLDDSSTLRIFAQCDQVFEMLAQVLALDAVPRPHTKGNFFCPPVLRCPPESAYMLTNLPYDSFGQRLESLIEKELLVLDVRENARIVIPSGPFAGATGEVDGFDREGNPRCRFMVRLKKTGKLKVPHVMLLGSWWLQAAADGTARQLPVVNWPRNGDHSPAALKLRALCEAY